MTISPRTRRLFADFAGMQELASQSERLNFRTDGEPPEAYELMFRLPGLARAADGILTLRSLHRCAISLHSDYPRRPPQLTWLTPVFHPNILGPERNGGVCIGSWSAGESLADLVRRLMDLVSYRTFNIDDALDRDAARTVSGMNLRPGADLREVLIAARPELDPPPEITIKPVT
jgi:ubiquitin-protein ligase